MITSLILVIICQRCKSYHLHNIIDYIPFHFFHPSAHHVPSGNHPFGLCFYDSVLKQGRIYNMSIVYIHKQALGKKRKCTIILIVFIMIGDLKIFVFQFFCRNITIRIQKNCSPCQQLSTISLPSWVLLRSCWGVLSGIHKT